VTTRRLIFERSALVFARKTFLNTMRTLLFSRKTFPITMEALIFAMSALIFARKTFLNVDAKAPAREEDLPER
jgi:hypothetical protein